MINAILIIVIVLLFGYIVFYNIQKRKNAEVEEKVDVDDKTYTLELMIQFVKKRLDEITKVNLYDIGLSDHA